MDSPYNVTFCWCFRFLVEQGIDHIVTLSSDKLPPHYAFPEVKWTMIPVEDFTGPTIGEIKKFLKIVDDARRNGEVRMGSDMNNTIED